MQLLSGAAGWDHALPILKTLLWLLMSYQVQFKMYKCFGAKVLWKFSPPISTSSGLKIHGGGVAGGSADGCGPGGRAHSRAFSVAAPHLLQFYGSMKSLLGRGEMLHAMSMYVNLSMHGHITLLQVYTSTWRLYNTSALNVLIIGHWIVYWSRILNIWPDWQRFCSHASMYWGFYQD